VTFYKNNWRAIYGKTGDKVESITQEVEGGMHGGILYVIGCRLQVAFLIQFFKKRCFLKAIGVSLQHRKEPFRKSYTLQQFCIPSRRI